MNKLNDQETAAALLENDPFLAGLSKHGEHRIEKFAIAADLYEALENAARVAAESEFDDAPTQLYIDFKV